MPLEARPVVMTSLINQKILSKKQLDPNVDLHSSSWQAVLTLNRSWNGTIQWR